MKKYILGLLLTFPLFVTGCATWGAADSFQAARLGAQSLEKTSALTCKSPLNHNPKTELACAKFERETKKAQEAINSLEAAWKELAPLLGEFSPEKTKVQKRDKLGE